MNKKRAKIVIVSAIVLVVLVAAWLCINSRPLWTFSITRPEWDKDGHLITTLTIDDYCKNKEGIYAFPVGATTTLEVVVEYCRDSKAIERATHCFPWALYSEKDDHDIVFNDIGTKKDLLEYAKKMKYDQDKIGVSWKISHNQVEPVEFKQDWTSEKVEMSLY